MELNTKRGELEEEIECNEQQYLEDSVNIEAFQNQTNKDATIHPKSQIAKEKTSIWSQFEV